MLLRVKSWFFQVSAVLEFNKEIHQTLSTHCFEWIKRNNDLSVDVSSNVKKLKTSPCRNTRTLGNPALPGLLMPSILRLFIALSTQMIYALLTMGTRSNLFPLIYPRPSTPKCPPTEALCYFTLPCPVSSNADGGPPSHHMISAGRCSRVWRLAASQLQVVLERWRMLEQGVDAAGRLVLVKSPMLISLAN